MWQPTAGTSRGTASTSDKLHGVRLKDRGCCCCRYQQPLAPAPYGAVGPQPGMYMQRTYQGEVCPCTCAGSSWMSPAARRRASCLLAQIQHGSGHNPA